MDREKIVIIGSGLAGLALAEMFPDSILIEVKRQPGGLFSKDNCPVAGNIGSEMINKLLYGKKVEIETAAYRLDSEGVWVINRNGSKKINGKVILATGFRERTSVELGIYGYRPAGIFPFTAAWDLVNMGYSLGEKVVIYGYNHYSLSLASKLSKLCDKIYIVYSRESLVHSLDEALSLGVDLIRGRIKWVEGRDRISLVKTDSEEIKTDALIIAEFAPWNQLGAEFLAGNAGMILESPLKVVESSMLLAELLKTGGNMERIRGNVPVLPNFVSERFRKVMLGVGTGIRVTVGGHVIITEEPYQVVEIPPSKPIVEVA